MTHTRYGVLLAGVLMPTTHLSREAAYRAALERLQVTHDQVKAAAAVDSMNSTTGAKT